MVRVGGVVLHKPVVSLGWVEVIRVHHRLKRKVGGRKREEVETKEEMVVVGCVGCVVTRDCTS